MSAELFNIFDYLAEDKNLSTKFRRIMQLELVTHTQTESMYIRPRNSSQVGGYGFCHEFIGKNRDAVETAAAEFYDQTHGINGLWCNKQPLVKMPDGDWHRDIEVVDFSKDEQ